MKNKRGITQGMTVFLWILGVVIVLSLIVGAGFFGAGFLAVTPTVVIDFDGEFDDSTVPEKVAGTALAIEDEYVEANEAFTVSYNATTNISVTPGLPYQFAFNIEVNGDMDNLELDADLVVATTEMIITKFYILSDEEGIALDSTNALVLGIVDTDNDEAELNMATILDGEYVIVVEAKTIAPGTITDGEELFTVSLDADSTDNDAVDEGVVTVYNA